MLNIKNFTRDNTSPNTNPKTLTTLNLTLNGRKDENIISHSKFLPKVVGWLGMWRTKGKFGTPLAHPCRFFRGRRFSFQI